MANGQLSTVLQLIRGLIGPSGPDDPTDGQLLDRFTNQRDEGAFTALVSRYGPMVLGVCRRVLQNSHDAEDAFQATFLVLVRKASTLTKHRPLGNWLYTVAVNTARKAKAGAARRSRHETAALVRESVWQPDLLAVEELRAVLDEELFRLPEKYRAPMVLCYLEGKTNDEAAGRLGWSKGTVSGRLARARQLLRGRLSRRGVALGSAAVAGVLESALADAAVPAPLLAATVRSASVIVAGKSATGALPVTVAVLTQGVLRAMFLTKLKTTAVVVLSATAIGAGVSKLTYHVIAAAQNAAPALVATAANQPDREAPDEPVAAEIKSLKHQDAQVRRKAASALGTLGPRARPAVLALIYALKDEDAGVRQAAATALGEIGPDAKVAVPVLLTRLKDKAADVRLRAAAALEKIATGDAEVRMEYAVGLAALGKAAVPFLIPLLRESEPLELRRTAARSLGDIGADAQAAVPDLAKLLHARQSDDGESPSWFAAVALGKIGPGAAEAVPALLATVQSGDPNAENAVLALGAIGPRAKAAVPMLLKRLKIKQAQEHELYFSVLIKIDPAALDLSLLEELVKEDRDVSLMAAEYLLKMNPTSKVLVPGLLRALNRGSFASRQQASRLLAAAAPAAREAIPRLVAALDDNNAGVRQEAAHALKRIDPEGAARIAVTPDAMPPDILSPADLRVYAKARRDAGQKTFDDCWKAFLAGRGTLETTFEWSLRWLEAEKGLSPTKAERLAALQAHLERMAQVENIVRLRHEARRSPDVDLTASEFHRLEAQIWLAEEKLK